MRLLYIKSDAIQENDVLETLQQLELEADVIDAGNRIRYQVNVNLAEELAGFLAQHEYDAVFTLNYDVSIAEACNDRKIRYISWVCETPCMELYHKSVEYSGNTVYVFDREICDELKHKGIKTIQYLPLGVNIERLQRMKASLAGQNGEKQPLSYIGNFHSAEANDYKALCQAINDPYISSYLDSVIQAQRCVPKHNILDRTFSEEVIQKMVSCVPCGNEQDSSVSAKYIYLNYFIYPRITRLERLQTLLMLSRDLPVGIFTKESAMKIGSCINFGYADYNQEVPAVICNSKINLNLTSRTTPNAVTQHALNVMGCGEFLISDHRNELVKLFETGKELIVCGSKEELRDKVLYYSTHEKERREIAENAWNAVKDRYDYRTVLKQILQL